MVSLNESEQHMLMQKINRIIRKARKMAGIPVQQKLDVEGMYIINCYGNGLNSLTVLGKVTSLDVAISMIYANKNNVMQFIGEVNAE